MWTGRSALFDDAARVAGAAITSVTADTIATGLPNACESVCRQFDVLGRPGDGVDAGMDDGGLAGLVYYSRVSCTVADAGTLMLQCTYYPTCMPR